MKLFWLTIVIFLTGCATTVPVAPKFPDATPELMKQCATLKKVENNQVAITEFMKAIVHNYSLYYQCAERVQGWHEWYNKQKKNFESAE